MSNQNLTDKVIQQVTQRLIEWGFTNHHTEEYGREKVLIIEFKEDLALYVSVAARGTSAVLITRLAMRTSQ